MEALNNREIAFAIWILLFATWVFSKKETRIAFKPVLDALAKKVILVPFLLLIFYTLASTWILSQIGIWNSSQIKSVILWFISVSTVSFFRIDKIADDNHYFKNAIKDNLKIVVFLEFLISFYTFHLVVELFFVPFMALIGALLGISQTDEKHILTQKILSKLIEVIGIVIVVYIAYRLIIDFHDFAQVQTIFDFAVPIALSILLLPLIFVFRVYVVYERVFIRIHLWIKDENLCTYAKKSAIIKYKLNLSALNRWADALNLKDVVTFSDVDELHKEIASLETEAKNPPVVTFNHGWSPYKISSALEEEGLKVGHYNKWGKNEWFASSSCLEVGKGILPNIITYYLEGNKLAVNKLKLKMNISEPEHAADTHKILCRTASLLCLRALGVELNQEFKNAIMEGVNKEDCIRTKMVRVSVEHWSNNRGYSVSFSISNI